MQLQTYADYVRDRMLNPTSGPPLTIRQLAQELGRTYEHIRKVVAGMPVVSKDLNTGLCAALGLDEEQMWTLAVREKAARTLSVDVPPELPSSLDERLVAAWRSLSPADRDVLLSVAEAMALANEARRARKVKRGIAKGFALRFGRPKNRA